MKLFLSSYFAETAALLKACLNENMQGKTVAFIPTSARVEQADFYVDEARAAWRALGVNIEETDAAVLNAEQLAEKLRRCHYIYVSGGNTFYLLEQLRLKQADGVIRQQIAEGKPYIGESAGSMILAENLAYAREMDDADAAASASDTGLGIIGICPLPHDGEYPFADVTALIRQKYAFLPLYPLNNKQAVFIDSDKGIQTTVEAV